MEKRKEIVLRNFRDGRAESYMRENGDQVLTLLKMARFYFYGNPKKNKVVLDLPNTSKMYWNVLLTVSSREEWNLYPEKVWYSRKKVKIRRASHR